jgi:TRAP-type uncharacterized transport system substrate-binding protein
MKRVLLTGVAAFFSMSVAHAQNITLTSASASPGGASDISAKFLAEVAAADKIATIQVQGGQVLTKTMVQVAQGKTDITASAFILNFLMSRGLGPYSNLGKEKGKVLAGNLQLLFPFHLAHFALVAFQTTRQVIRLASGGLVDGKGYTGKQIAWGQADSIFLDRTVDAAVRPATNPASWVPVLMSAGKLNMVSIPKKLFEGKAFVKYANAPGNAAVVFPVKDLAHYGPKVRIITDDDMFRSIANSGGTMVNKNMSKKMAKALTASFVKHRKDLWRKTAFAKTSQFGNIDNKNFNFCKAGIKFHPGAVEAWEEAGFKVIACAK